MAGAVIGIAASALGGALASSLTLGVLNAGIGLTFTQGLFAGRLAGFLLSSAISQVGQRAFAKKPKSASFTQDVQGRQIVLRSAVETHKIVYGRAKVSGPLTFAHVTESGPDSTGATVTARFLHLVIPVAGHEVDSFESISFDDTTLTLNGSGFATNAPYFKDSKSYARIKTYSGTSSQTASTELLAECSDKWTTNHRGRGIAYIYVRLQKNQDVYPNGIPNITVILKGKKIYDPRTATTVWTDNATLCTRDYLVSDYGLSCSSTEVDDTIGNASHNISDENVTLADATTQDRYTCNGVIDRGTAVIDNLNMLTTSFAGAVTYSTGKFRIHAGAYDTPAYTIDVDWLSGAPKLRSRTPKKELFNAVRGTFSDESKSYQATDFPAVVNSTYQIQDNGERLFRDIELPFSTNSARCQRLAKIALEKARQGLILELPCNYKAVRVAVWDVVLITLPIFGFSAKPFRVLKWNWSPQGGVTLMLQEESSASYSWNSGEQTSYDSAPDTNLPNPLQVNALTGLTYDSREAVTVGGDTIYNLVAIWNLSDDSYVQNFGQIEIQYKLSSAADWRPSIIVQGRQTFCDLLTSSPNVSYDIRVRAVNSLGVRSNWTTLTGAIIGSSGPVTSTLDYVNWTTAATAFGDYVNWTTTATAFADYGSF